MINRILSLLLINSQYFFSHDFLVYKSILLISDWRLIRLNDKSMFPNSETPITNIMYG